MNEEFNKQFIELSEKDQKAILNLIQLKNMNKKTEYKKRIDQAIEYINGLEDYPMLTRYNCLEILEILKGKEQE